MAELLNDRLSIFPVTAKVSPDGRLFIAGCDTVTLAQQYGTPLYVYDGATIKGQISRVKELMREHYGENALVAYASKAYFSYAFAKKLAEFGIGADLVSIGDIRVAQKAGLDPDGIHLHGNNKSAEEINAALDWGIQAIVVDSLDELDFVEALAAQKGKPARIWLRITPDLTVDTHPHIQTSHPASKFGLHILDGQANQAIRKAQASQWLKLVGLHTHLGSQLRDTQVYVEAIEKMYTLAGEEGFIPEEFSPGGGWGVRYTEEDPANDPEPWIAAVSSTIKAQCLQRGWPLPRLVVEPGRFTVAQAGVALYTIGAQKNTPDGTRILAVDGGIADNPRVALYAARYTALIANKANLPATTSTRVVGKFCETGDVLIDHVTLPEAARGEILAIPAAGAYQLSMASNYNFAARPAVLWLEDGKVEVMQPLERPEQSSWWMNP
jgi:diaminopimelate decarboxylase